MSELAIVSARKPRLKALAGAHGRGAEATLRLIENPSRFHSSVQIGITLSSILAAAARWWPGALRPTHPNARWYRRSSGTPEHLLPLVPCSLIKGGSSWRAQRTR
jgi:hypothetical protein